MKIKTATEKEFLCDFFVMIHLDKGPRLDMRIKASMSEVAITFSDKENSKQLWYADEYYAGFTKLVLLVQEPDCVRICLEKE